MSPCKKTGGTLSANKEKAPSDILIIAIIICDTNTIDRRIKHSFLVSVICHKRFYNNIRTYIDILASAFVHIK